jgi:hypothetical protein
MAVRWEEIYKQTELGDNMELRTPQMGPPPSRKSRPKPNPLDKLEPYTQLKALIAHGKIKPNEEYGITIDPTDAKRIGLKFPARTATDGLRRFVKELGLQSDYQVVKYETRDPGSWYVCVRNVSPVKTKKPLA